MSLTRINRSETIELPRARPIRVAAVIDQALNELADEIIADVALRLDGTRFQTAKILVVVDLETAQ